MCAKRRRFAVAILATTAFVAAAHAQAPGQGRSFAQWDKIQISVTAKRVPGKKKLSVGSKTTPVGPDFGLMYWGSVGIVIVKGYFEIPLRSGVSLIGERGPLGSRPRLFNYDKAEANNMTFFEITGNDVLSATRR